MPTEIVDFTTTLFWRQFMYKNRHTRHRILENEHTCPECGKPSDKDSANCLPCIFDKIWMTMPYEIIADQCRLMQLRWYPDKCEHHGVTLRTTRAGECIMCRNNPDLDRAAARKGGRKKYLSQCAVHGLTQFSIYTGFCLTCTTTTGAPRIGYHGDPLRIHARENGDRSYICTCEYHGAVPHDTWRGRCLTCYNTMGMPRPGSPVRKG